MSLALTLTLSLSSVVLAEERNAGAAQIWPLPSRTDFSSGFGDFRPGRFHYGIDLRTGEKRLAVVAPVAGYLSQVRVSYFGYGKGLYLKGENGFTYVFAHLNNFAPELDQFVKRRQREEKRYFIREWFKPDQFPVKQGDTIAFSGKTGIGAPHLHFEVRDTTNVPRSPLGQGYYIPDKTAPQVLSVTFEYLSQRTVFPNGQRRMTIKAELVSKDADGTRRYTLEEMPYLSAEFGLILSAKDYPTNKSFSTSPRKIRFQVASILKGAEKEYRTVFELELDSLSYSEGALANCVYEQGMANGGDKSAYLLYQRDSLSGCYSERDWEWVGRFPDSVAGSSAGVFAGRCEVFDASGNLSILDFNFALGPRKSLYRLLDIGADFALVAPVDQKLLKNNLDVLDVRVAELSRSGGWSRSKDAQIEKLKDGALRIGINDLRGLRSRRVFRLMVKGFDGWLKPDLIISSVPLSEKAKVSLDYELRDGGLYVRAVTSSATTRAPQIRAITASDDRIELSPLQIGARQFSCFLPPDTNRSPVIRIEVYRSESDEEPASQLNGLQLVALGGASVSAYRERETTLGTIFAPVGGLDQPRTLEFDLANGLFPLPRNILAGPFEIGPGDFRFDYPVRVGIRPPTELDSSTAIAICKLSKKDDKWDWFDTEYSGGVFWAETQENGVYALLVDRRAPDIIRISPAENTRASSRRPVIRAQIEDDLSGIWEDTLFEVYVDDEWLIPEYDAEDFDFVARPAKNLAPGTHELKFVVRDNAGNIRKRILSFIVK